MDYKETINFLFSQLPMFQNEGQKALNNKLDKSLALDAYFAHPHRSYMTVHVGGTNGKGSVAHLIASVLQSSGYKVGLYTSPHLKDFRERIKVDGVACSKDFVVDFVAVNSEKITEIKPSFFEMTVAMAFQYFKEQQVDIAVVEVGLGGRLDSTNIINPLLSIITNISIDHTSMLGNSLEEIAFEKAGIIKESVPVVIGEYQAETVSVFEAMAKKKDAPLFYANKEECIHNIRTYVHEIEFDWKNISDIVCPLKTIYQQKNIQTALVSLEILREKQGLKISDQSISEGIGSVIEQTHFKGRWQILGRDPLIVCDTAHNEAGINMAMAELKKTKYSRLHFVYGTSADKDLQNILPLLPLDAIYYFTQANVQRAMPVEILKKEAAVYGLNGDCFTTVKKAFDESVKNAEKQDVIYVGGSVFVVAELDL